MIAHMLTTRREMLSHSQWNINGHTWDSYIKSSKPLLTQEVHRQD